MDEGGRNPGKKRPERKFRVNSFPWPGLPGPLLQFGNTRGYRSQAIEGTSKNQKKKRKQVHSSASGTESPASMHGHDRVPTTTRPHLLGLGSCKHSIEQLHGTMAKLKRSSLTYPFSMTLGLACPPAAASRRRASRRALQESREVGVEALVL